MPRFKGCVSNIDRAGRVTVRLSRTAHPTHRLGAQTIEAGKISQGVTLELHQSVTFELVERSGPVYAADVQPA